MCTQANYKHTCEIVFVASTVFYHSGIGVCLIDRFANWEGLYTVKKKKVRSPIYEFISKKSVLLNRLTLNDNHCLLYNRESLLKGSQSLMEGIAIDVEG